jgi:alpha-N-acetylglucosaminidase
MQRRTFLRLSVLAPLLLRANWQVGEVRAAAIAGAVKQDGCPHRVASLTPQPHTALWDNLPTVKQVRRPTRLSRFPDVAMAPALILACVLFFGGVRSAQAWDATEGAAHAPVAAAELALAQDAAVLEARGVIAREFGQEALRNVQFGLIKSADQHDVFEYEAAKSHLVVRGSSAVALCSGFYQYIKRNHLGIASWSGNRLDLAQGWPDTSLERESSPYRYRYYLNVVTYGYTTPYWSWDRWQREIDWMALHGINMPLSLVATEAIGERVWKKLGLTQKEIDAYDTGPAYLPWGRMGNIAGLDGPLAPGWNDGQIALEHKILNRERALGMSPVAQGFAGFVPVGLQRLHPGIKLSSMAWAGFSEPYRNHILSPDSPMFSEIGSLTIKEWEAEFGKVRFFLSDSFNEMHIPASTEAAKDALLARYGAAIYRSIRDGDPDATWVMQGWMFGYMRDVWTKDSLHSLLSGVPDDKMLILDEAMDYNANFWRNGMDRDVYDGFWGKQWIGGYIPNMGGKTAFTGILDFYAHAGSDALASKNRGNLVGLGMAPEGIENNEVIYELISDTFWQSGPIDLDAWIANYSLTRYGAHDADITKAWHLLIESSYASFVDHPRFIWQLEPGSNRSSINPDAKVIEAAEHLLAASGRLKANPLYRDDAIEVVAMAAGIRADQLIKQAVKFYAARDFSRGEKSADMAFGILGNVDRLLASHPNLQLKSWVDSARARGDTPAERDHYERDAKMLVTLWGSDGEIDDYSSRIWSGLIGGYYVPRWRMYIENLAGAHHDIRRWEKQWVRAAAVDQPQPFADPMEAAGNILAHLHDAPP